MKQYLGIIGDPVAHTLSPVMHQAALAAQGLDYRYLPFRVAPENLADAVGGLRALGFVGVNVTIPHKVAVIAHVDRLSPEAELIGAVNTLHREQGRWVGYNTDGPGFLRSLKEDGGREPGGARILLLGAGGAARGVAGQLGLARAGEIVIANRHFRRAEELAREMGEKLPHTTYRAIEFETAALRGAMRDAEIIIQATPLGMDGYPQPAAPMPEDGFRAGHCVMDLVYRPQDTAFLRQARAAGAHTVSGIGMLVYQGAESYRIWTETDPPAEVMRSAVLACLDGEK